MGKLSEQGSSQASMAESRTQVVVVGGSLVGLSAAVFLAARGVPHIVIERHVGSAVHPRAVGFTQHSMEFFRASAVGLGDRIPQVDPSFRLRRVRVASLATLDKVLEETLWTPDIKPTGAPASGGSKPPPPKQSSYSPCTGAAIAQDRLEPILRARACELGSDIRQGQEMVSFHQDEQGVTLVTKDRKTGEECVIRAQYMIACDGAKGGVRDALGIGREGVGHLQTVQSVLFRCPGADQYLSRGYQQFEIQRPGTKAGAFLTTYGDSRWVLMLTDDADRSAEEWETAIATSLGRDDLPFEVITTGRWEMSGLIAEKYSVGRVFLAGDAAHQLPPTRGGFGANTGIDDAYNLAWKLQFVVAGWSTPALLDTYNDERRPIGWLRHQQTFSRPDYAKYITGGSQFQREELLEDVALELGQLSNSSAVIGAGADLPRARRPDEWSGQPGTRAPHVFVHKKGEVDAVSTVDLFTMHFVLMSQDSAWKPAAESASSMLGFTVEFIHVGSDVCFPDTQPFTEVFGLDSESGATLVRPDGLVAWRARLLPPHPIDGLIRALAHIAASPKGIKKGTEAK